MSAIAIVNGQFVDTAAPAVSVFDAAVLHGDAYFETLRTYDGRPALLGAHLARLASAMRAAGFSDPPSATTLEEEVAEAVNEFSEGDVVVRISVSRGVRDQGSHEGPEETTRIVTARLLDEPAQPAEASAQLVEVADYSYPHKSSNYQLQAGLIRAAQDAGFDEALITDAGELIEGAKTSVLLIEGDELIAPALGRCLPGITRAALLDLAPSVGLKPVERTVATSELAAADEILIANSLIETRRVTRLGSDPAGGRDTTAAESLRAALAARLAAGA